MSITDRVTPTGLTHTTVDQLLRVTQLFASDPDIERHVRDRDDTERAWTRLEATDRLEVWLISWPAGTSTGWHDHQGSRGAFHVVSGALTEHTWSATGPRGRVLGAGHGRPFGAHHIHNVTNLGDRPAVSVHAYSPALRGMTRYDVSSGSLVRQGFEPAGLIW